MPGERLGVPEVGPSVLRSEGNFSDENAVLDLHEIVLDQAGARDRPDQLGRDLPLETIRGLAHPMRRCLVAANNPARKCIDFSAALTSR